MKIIRTTFPDGITIKHKEEVKNIQMIVSDHKFEAAKQRAKELRQQAEELNLYNEKNRRINP